MTHLRRYGAGTIVLLLLLAVSIWMAQTAVDQLVHDVGEYSYRVQIERELPFLIQQTSSLQEAKHSLENAPGGNVVRNHRKFDLDSLRTIAQASQAQVVRISQSDRNVAGVPELGWRTVTIQGRVSQVLSALNSIEQVNHRGIRRAVLSSVDQNRNLVQLELQLRFADGENP